MTSACACSFHRAFRWILLLAVVCVLYRCFISFEGLHLLGEYKLSSLPYPTSRNLLKVILLTVQSSERDTAYGYKKANVLASLCLRNKEIYADLLGLQYFIGGSAKLSAGSNFISPRLLKVHWILQLLKRGFQRIIYMDLDTLFLLPLPSLVNVLKTMNESIAIAYDWKRTKIIKKTNRKRKNLAYRYASNNAEQLQARYNTGIMLICKSEPVLQFFESIFDASVRMGLKEDVSDQKLFNAILPKHLAALNGVRTLDRVVFNSFPLITTGPYVAMGLPLGDEETNKSVVIHFAGAFGGASIS